MKQAPSDDCAGALAAAPHFPIISVSIPRSGHHILMKLLQDVIGDRFTYCEFYGPARCCQKVPCAHSVTVQKSHDFRLDQPQLKELRYLVEFRNFVSSTISDYKLFSQNNAIDSRSIWLNFAMYRLEYYKKFMHKWVFNGSKNIFKFNYDLFIQYPEQQMKEVIDFIGLPTAQPYSEVISEHNIKLKNSDEEFKYYDPETFALFESLLSGEYDRAEIRKRYDGVSYFRHMTPAYPHKVGALLAESRNHAALLSSAVAQRDAALAERASLAAERASLVADRDDARERERAARAERDSLSHWARLAFYRPERALLRSLSYRVHKSLSKWRILPPATRTRLSRAARKRRPF